MKKLEKLINMVFPSRCIFCDGLVNIDFDVCVCKSCADEVEKLNNQCVICGVKLSDCKYGNLCSSCKRKMCFDFLKACYPYKGQARSSILRLKFSNCIDYGRTMAKIMVRMLNKEDYQGFCVTSMPISDERMKERKYNQADLIGYIVSKELGLPYQKNLLVKVKDTLKQSTLNEKERWENIEDAYDVLEPEKISGSKIILVDDVCTTGATLNEAAKMLKSYGALDVHCITFAASNLEWAESFAAIGGKQEKK